jgi:hypothetical protein
MKSPSKSRLAPQASIPASRSARARYTDDSSEPPAPLGPTATESVWNLRPASLVATNGPSEAAVALHSPAATECHLSRDPHGSRCRDIRHRGSGTVGGSNDRHDCALYLHAKKAATSGASRAGLATMRSNFALRLLARHRDRLGSRWHAEFCQDRRDVVVDRLGRHEQALRYAANCAALG